MPPVFRFAPSPNGYLHLGHALSALLNADMTRAAGGRLLLRIEDIDETRCRPEYEAAIYEDLAWLGIEWEEPVRRQSEHYADYRVALEKLDAMGLIYRAYETRSEIGRTASGARSGRRAALPGAPQRHHRRRRAKAPHRCRRALRVASRHGGGHPARRSAHLGRNRRRPRRRDGDQFKPTPPPGAT